MIIPILIQNKCKKIKAYIMFLVTKNKISKWECFRPDLKDEREVAFLREWGRVFHNVGA